VPRVVDDSAGLLSIVDDELLRVDSQPVMTRLEAIAAARARLARLVNWAYTVISFRS
jgi:hypothetical protein